MPYPITELVQATECLNSPRILKSFHKETGLKNVSLVSVGYFISCGMQYLTSIAVEFESLLNHRILMTLLCKTIPDCRYFYWLSVTPGNGTFSGSVLQYHQTWHNYCRVRSISMHMFTEEAVLSVSHDDVTNQHNTFCQ
ncbi:hypothetical protein RRG08_066135 [Elysia crispata]|uniref:Uncharacterized protein n=1 Tax=Elysia crispata TaxID=231223 RepID=A0AAE1BA04_9GAST|nr:hypothetical protein RRG08_066135 [Elysia crispata]